MLLECKKFPEIFLEKMRVYRVKKKSDRQMAPFGQTVASASLRGSVDGLASLWLLILKRNLNGFSPDLGSKNPTDRSSGSE